MDKESIDYVLEIIASAASQALAQQQIDGAAWEYTFSYILNDITEERATSCEEEEVDFSAMVARLREKVEEYRTSHFKGVFAAHPASIDGYQACIAHVIEWLNNGRIQ